jgi:hypothetical protein
MRRLEVRIGHLLGDAKPGNPTGANQHGGTSVATEVPPLSKDQRHEFRQMADHEDLVEQTIAESTDDSPASRAKVLARLRAEREAAVERLRAELLDWRHELRLLRQPRAARPAR